MPSSAAGPEAKINSLSRYVSNASVLGVLLALGCYAAFSGSDATLKFMGGSYHPIAVAFYGEAFYLVCVLACASRLGGMKETLRTRKRGLHALRSVAVALVYFLVVYSFCNIPLADAYTLVFSMPFFAAVLAIPLLGERIGPHRWTAILIGFIGILVALRPGFETLSLPALAALAAGFFFAVANVLIVKMENTETLLSFCLFPTFVTIPISGLATWYLGEGLELPDFGLFALSGVLMTVGSLMLNKAYMVAQASLISPFQYTQLVWGGLLGYFIFGDEMDGWMGLGALIIVLSGLYLIYREYKAHSALAEIPVNH